MTEEELKLEATQRAEISWKHDLIGNFCQIKKEFKDIKWSFERIEKKFYEINRYNGFNPVDVISLTMFIFFALDISVHIYKFFA